MIYSCQHCGAWFDANELKTAIDENQNTIICKYCNNLNDIGRVKTSHIARGFDLLEIGDFYNATMEFREGLKPARNLDLVAKGPYLDAYLGYALAQFSVQVIYGDEIADRTKNPEIYCYLCNEMFLEDSREYQTALDIARNINDIEYRKVELARIERFAKYIDGIKKVYDERQRQDVIYNLFIAYEDESDDRVTDFNVANRIRNNMPSKISNIFLPDREDYINDIQYEGEILYAIHNSNCMLVVADDDIDVRLMNIYSRYYWVLTTGNDKFKQKELGFVRFKEKIQIQLPGHSVSNNIFEIDNVDDYQDLVLVANGLLKGKSGPIITDPAPGEKPGSGDTIITPLSLGDGAPKVVGNLCRFGVYPQRLVGDISIVDQFKALPKPTMSQENGWNIMFRSRSGKPYTWYLDKEINGKKYRAVYFMKFREVYTVRDSDLQPSVQRMARYIPMNIYVFAYEPIEWNILDVSQKSAVLISAVGIDCREFNNSGLSSDWEYSTIREWLNDDFINTAFTEDQKKYLFIRDDDSISLVDSELDFGKKYYRDKIDSYNINGSDYFKCIGGFSGLNVSNFWIKSPEGYDDKAAAIQPHSVGYTVPQCVDNTTVSVVPKIVVRWNQEQ